MMSKLNAAQTMKGADQMLVWTWYEFTQLRWSVKSSNSVSSSVNRMMQYNYTKRIMYLIRYNAVSVTTVLWYEFQFDGDALWDYLSAPRQCEQETTNYLIS